MSVKRLALLIGCYFVWCLFNWVPSLQALIIGLPVAVMVVLMTEKIPFGKVSDLHFQPMRHIRFIFHYMPVFWWEHLKANVEVAYRVLHPNLPIRPAIVRVKTGLRTDMGLTLLANSVSLVPGTTSVDVDPEKGLIYVHCMCVSPSEIDGLAKKRVQKFEKILVKIFE